MQYSSIFDIYDRLEEILENKRNVSPEQIGSYIVGCTIVLDDIRDYYEQYPILEEIAEAGADLEWQGKEYHQEYLDQIRKDMVELKALLKPTSGKQ